MRKILTSLGIVLAFTALATAQNVAVYMEQGGAKQVVANGGEIEVQSGGTLDVQSGATSTFGGTLGVTGVGTFTAQSVHTGGVDLNGNSTATNITMDTGSTLAAKAVTCTTIAVSGAADFSGNVTIDGTLAITGAIANASTIVLTNSANAGTCSMTTYADIHTDAGDMARLLFGDNGGMAFQTDKDVKGTLATKLTIGETGIVTMKGGATLDNTTSATALTITETTVAIVGAETVSGTLTVTGAADFNANSTATNITMDTGSTLAAKALTATSITDSGSLILTPGTIANAAGVYTQTVAAASYVLEPSGINTQRFANGTSGQIVVIKNNAATNVVIDVAAGDVTLGDNDCVTLGYLGTEWITISTKDN